ncbi:MAG: hypothetical protein WCF23_03375 [Candidatus Nitrosopolaris sp.]
MASQECEEYMLKKVKEMDDIPIEGMRWKHRKLKYAVGGFEDILYVELQLRRDKGNFEHI